MFKKVKKILFVTWDGPQTSYLEGLFMPIFFEISQKLPVDFHIIQFTWSDYIKTFKTKKEADKLGIKYISHPVFRKPFTTFGSIITLIKGVAYLKKYIDANEIDIVMPRSTMPIIMLNRIKLNNCRIIFEADGLPLEERVDFSGLSKQSKQYKWLKYEEIKMLLRADKVITRSKRSIDFHLESIGERYRDKFSVIYNGRNPDIFKPNLSLRDSIRAELDIAKDERVFVYCGSLGPQYGWKEMIMIYEKYLIIDKKATFLILTGSLEFANKNMPARFKNKIIVKRVPFKDVPKYLNIADIAFAIREPKTSMKGVAPIKLGEYLLMGIPTIASAGIGDSEAILNKVPNCFLFEHTDQSINDVMKFLSKPMKNKQYEIREIGLQYFSLNQSVQSYLNKIYS